LQASPKLYVMIKVFTPCGCRTFGKFYLILEQQSCRSYHKMFTNREPTVCSGSAHAGILRLSGK